MVPTDPPDIRSLLAEEERRQEHPEARKLRYATFLAPILVTIGLLIVIAILSGPDIAGKLVVWAMLIFTVLGKFAILGGVSDADFNVWQLASIVAYMDITIAVMIVLNLPRLYRVPRVGPIIEELAEHGLYMLETNRWLSRVTFLGVVAFVMFPLTGTGAVGGAIFGRLMGLPTVRTLAAIAVGSLVGCFGLAAFAGTLQTVLTEEFRQSWEFRLSGAAVLALLVVVVWHRGKRVAAEMRRRREQRQNGLQQDDVPETGSRT